MKWCANHCGNYADRVDENEFSDICNECYIEMREGEYEVLGGNAMAFISDYPLYASTSEINYPKAIAIADIIDPDWRQNIDLEKSN